jgi:hypothetical protein
MSVVRRKMTGRSTRGIGSARHVFALASIACAAMLFAPWAAAGGVRDYPDSVRENPAALDIANVQVNNDNAGGLNVLIGFRAAPMLPADADLGLLLDTDRDHSTGDSNGMEYAVWLYGEDNSYEFLRWNGSDYDDAGELQIMNLPVLGVLIHLDRSQIGDVETFDFAVATVRGPQDAPVVDLAPDDGTWTYKLAITPAITSVVPQLRPARPTAGHAFTIGARVRLATGQVVPATSVRCTARLGGKALRGSGAGGCRFQIPKAARGQRLVIKLTAGYRDAEPVAATKIIRVD